MSILKRFSDIMSSNINSALDKLEDPEKMVDQYIRNLEKDLSQVKKETATIMANEKSMYREVSEAEQKIRSMSDLAFQAVNAGNDNDAKRFLEEKNKWERTLITLNSNYEIAKLNSDKMRQMHDKLVRDLNDLNERKKNIKSMSMMAKTQKNINRLNEAMGSASGTLNNFDRLEQKASRMLDEANAMSELNLSSTENSMKELESKYAGSTNSSGQTVDDELAALKASIDK